MADDAAPSRALTPMQEIRQQMMSPETAAQFRMALPAHVPVERFQRVALTAIANNPDLLRADRRSLFNACGRAAQDGLLPDGREAALVMFGSAATYMPMVAGILKKVRNSGELAAIAAHVVYANDRFEMRLGDTEELIHVPPPLGQERGDAVGAYAVATLKNGEKMREVMSKKEIEKVRAVSRSRDKGPWVQWWEEMARKTAIRRLAKRLPMSTDRDEELRRVIERDDEMAELQDAAAPTAAAAIEALLTAPEPAHDGGDDVTARTPEDVTPTSTGSPDTPDYLAEIAAAQSITELAAIDARIRAATIDSTTKRNLSLTIAKRRAEMEPQK